MKYFNPTYWFKLWVLSAPLFNDETKGINAKSINNKKIKDWASNNTSLESINQEISYTNSSTNYQPYNLSHQVTNQTNLESIASQKLETSTHKHRHEKSKSRLKREMDGDNLVTTKYWFMGTTEFFASFTPDFWEEIYFLYYDSSDVLNFSRKFKEKCVDAGFYMTSVSLDWFTNDYTNYGLRRIGGIIYKNMNKIDNIWQNSDKKHRIRITGKLNDLYHLDAPEYFEEDYSSTNIRDDENEKTFSNKYLNKLQRDFPDYNKKKINLGIIKYDYVYDYDDVWINILKNKYRNLKIKDIESVDHKDYSHFSQDYSFKIKVKYSTKEYSHGILRPRLSYITQTKLSEISNIIANDEDIKKWIKDINDWNSTLPQAIENAKTFTPQVLYNWRRQEKETIKNYLARWNTNMRIINNELKIDELNENVQGLKSSFDSIKKQINDLDRRVNKLEQSNDCEDYGSDISAGAGVVALVPIPALQLFAGGVSALSTAFATTCSSSLDGHDGIVHPNTKVLKPIIHH